MTNINKALLFDFDGVLVDSFEISYKISLIANKKWRSRKHYRDLFSGNIYNTFKTAKVPKKNNFFDLYGPQLMELKLASHAGPIIKKLSKKYRLFIVSSTPGPLIKTFLTEFHINAYFKNILGSDFHTSKIRKTNFLLKQYRLSPKNCLFITDTVGDIKEARSCGVQSLAITGGFHSKNTLKKATPLKVVGDWKQLEQEIKNYFSKK